MEYVRPVSDTIMSDQLKVNLKYYPLGGLDSLSANLIQNRKIEPSYINKFIQGFCSTAELHRAVFRTPFPLGSDIIPELDNTMESKLGRA